MPSAREVFNTLKTRGRRTKERKGDEGKSDQGKASKLEASNQGRSQSVSAPGLVEEPEREEIPIAPEQTSASTAVESHSKELCTTIHNSLWHVAYATLRSERSTSKYVIEYERLLLKVFLEDTAVESTVEDNEKNSTISTVSSEESQLRKIIEKGLEKVERSRNIIEGSIKIQEAIAPVREILDIPLKNITQTALPWAIVTSSLDLLMKPAKTMAALYNGVSAVNARIEWYSKMTDGLLSPGNGNISLEQARILLNIQMLRIYQSLLFYQIKSVCFYYRNQFVGILRAFVDLDDWDGDLSAVTSAENKLHHDLSLYKSQQIMDKLNQFSDDFERFSRAQNEREAMREDKQCMKDLFKIDPRSEMRKIQKARGDPVKEIYDWILKTSEFKCFIDWEDPESPNILRINGQAGTGKTMLSVGVIQELLSYSIQDIHRSEVIYFFIQDKGEEFNSSSSILRGLMWLLLVQNPALIRYLRPRYDQSGPSLFRNSQSFTDLLPIFLEMLQDDDLGQVFIILDALDECKGPADEHGGLGKDIFELLSELLPADTTTSKVKIFVTSRPLLEIDAGMQDVSPLAKGMIQLDDHSLSGPIHIYIDLQKPRLMLRVGGNSLPHREALVDSTIRALKENAGRTFLWVYLVCDQLLQQNFGKWKQTLAHAPPKLESLYGFLLDRLKASEHDRWFGYCKEVLLFVMLACRPLSLSEIEAFVRPPSDIDLVEVVQDCRSFLTVQRDTVYPIHKSATDYLQQNFKELKNAPLHELHHEVFERALQSMENNLTANMCSLANHGVLIEEIDTLTSGCLQSVRYFCQYWCYHLKNGGLQCSNTERIYEFLSVHLLHWLEGLSLLRILSVAVDIVNELQFLVPRNEEDILSPFLADVKRFLAKFTPVIAEAPLQIYVSALVFAPEKSKVREIFQQKKPHWVSRIRPSETAWSSLLGSFQPNGNWGFGAVSISPKGDLMAGSSRTKSLDVYNIATGTLLRSLGQGPWYTSHFAPCGGLLAAGAWNDGTVMVWDTSKWEMVKLLDHHGGDSLTCEFSPTGDVLGTASWSAIRLWDVKTWTLRWSISELLSYRSLFTFSYSGDVVSVRCDELSLYDVDTGEFKSMIHIKPSQHGLFRDLIFSPNGLLVAVIYYGEIRVLKWPDMSGVFTQHNDCTDLQFSPNSLLLAVAGIREETQLWNTKDWSLVHTFKSGTYVQYLAFSSDGQVLISTTADGVINLWDLTSFTMRETEGQPPNMSSERLFLRPSPGGHYVATRPGGKDLEIWDCRTGNSIFTHHSETPAGDLVFSPDDRFLVTSHEDQLIVWNVKTGYPEQQFQIEGNILQYYGLEFVKTGSDSEWECIGRDGEIRIPFYIQTPLPSGPEEIIKYNYDTGWVVRVHDTERLIWIPPDIRPNHDAPCVICGQTVVLCDLNGQVLFLSFHLDSLETRNNS